MEVPQLPMIRTLSLVQTLSLLLGNVQSPSTHRVFFDNCFTSFHLMSILGERRFFATGMLLVLVTLLNRFHIIFNISGTVQQNRVDGAMLPEKIKKGDYKVLFEREKSLFWSAGKIMSTLYYLITRKLSHSQ